MDLEKTYDRVDREAQWQVMEFYDVSGKLLNGIKSMHVNSLAFVGIKCSNERHENLDGEEGRE